MEVKTLKKNKLIQKTKSGRAGHTLALPEGYSSLLILSEKYGYAKDYVGWLSRTGRIDAIRSGKYGQWYASEDSLKNYISSLVVANEQRYLAQKSLVSARTIAELAISRTEIASSDKDNPASRVSSSTGSIIRVDGSDTDSRIISNEDEKKFIVKESQPSRPVARQTPLIDPLLKSSEKDESKVLETQEETLSLRGKPAEFSFPYALSAEPKTRPVVPTVPFSVLLPRHSELRPREDKTNKSSLSAEKQLAKRLNAALTVLMLLGGILILTFFSQKSGQLSLVDATHSIGRGIKSPLSYVWHRFFDNFSENIYITIIGDGERGEKGEPGRSGATVIKEVKITENLIPEQIDKIYGKINDANSRIDILVSQVLSLSSSAPSIQPIYISPSLQLPSTNTVGVGPITLNPSNIDTETLTVSGNARVKNLVASQNANIAGYASASQFFGAGLSDCDAEAQTLNWNESTGTFSCLNDDGGSGGSANLQVKEGLLSILSSAASISFEAGAFDVTSSASIEAVVKLDYTNGPASRSVDQTITGFWEFRNGASFSNDVEFYNILSNRFATFSSSSLGRFSLGDSTPETFFEVASSSGIVASISNTFFVDATNKYVGIGTMAPSIALEIKTAAQGTYGLTLSNGTGNQTLNLESSDSSGYPHIQISGAVNGLNFQGSGKWQFTNDTDVIKVQIDTNSGFVGIGTSAPSTKLEVQGTASASYFMASGSVQFGSNLASATYSRFGSTVTGHSNYIRSANDLLISGDLEVDGSISAQFASVSQLFIFNNSASASALFGSNGSGVANESNFSIGVGNGTERLSIFNNSKSPIVTIASNGFVGIGSSSPANRLAISDGTLSVDNPKTPTLMANYDTVGTAKGVFVSGNFAYVADSTEGLIIFDISNPASISKMSTFNTGGATLDVKVSGKYAYVIDTTLGLNVVDISNPKAPTRVGLYIMPETPGKGFVVGNYVYITGNSLALKGLRVVDVSNPSSPKSIGTRDIGESQTAIYVSGRYAYTVGSKLNIFDISNPAFPIFVSSLSLNSSTNMGIYVSGRYAYISGDNPSFDVVDVSNPRSPAIVGTVSTTTTGGDVFVGGKYAYVIDDDDFHIIDITNPYQPFRVIKFDVPTSGHIQAGIFVSGHYAYLTTGSGGFSIVDIKGADIHALTAGNINTNNLTILESANIGNSLSIKNGLNIGQGGLLVNGPFALNASFSYTTASTSAQPLLSINHTKGYLSGDAILANLAASTSQEYFSGNFLRFTRGSAGNSVFIVEANGNVLASGAAQFGAAGVPASASYSRFGTSTTGHANYITASNDLLISGDLEVDGSISAQFASVSQFFISNDDLNAIYISDPDVTHGLTNTAPTNTYGLFGITAVNLGGLSITGLSDANNAEGLSLVGIIGSTDPNDALTAVEIIGAKSAGGANIAELGNLETILGVKNNTGGSLFSVLGGGFVGIGTITPTTKLEVQGTASASYLLTGNTLQVGGFSSAAYSRFGTGTTTEAHYITDSTDVLISGDLEVDGSVSFAGPASISNTLYVSTLGNTGNVGIGTTAPGAQLDLSTDSARKLTTTTWSTGSDSRIKTQIETIDNALDVIGRIRPVKYHYTSEYITAHPSIKDTEYYHFIAQEYAEVFPDSVNEVEGLFYLNSSNMIPYAIAGIKALDDKTTSLSLRIEDLEAWIASQSQNYGLGNNTYNISAIASGLLIWLKDSLHIVFEDGLVRVANIITEKLITKELCLEDTCVNQEQLRALLEKNSIEAIETPIPTPVESSIPSPEGLPEASSSPDQPDTTAPSEETSEPSSTLESTSEPAVSEPSPDTTPEIIPIPIPEMTPELVSS